MSVQCLHAKQKKGDDASGRCRVDRDGDVNLRFSDGSTFTWNSECLVKETDEQGRSSRGPESHTSLFGDVTLSGPAQDDAQPPPAGHVLGTPTSPPSPARGSAQNCPGRCGLVAGETPRHGFGCDVCGATLPAGARVRSCRRCNFDVCERCSVRDAALSDADAGPGGATMYTHCSGTPDGLHTFARSRCRCGATCRPPADDNDIPGIVELNFTLG